MFRFVLLLALAMCVAGFAPAAVKRQSRSAMAMSLTRADVVNTIKTATSADQLLTGEMESFMKEAGDSMYPKLMKRIRRKASELGTEVNKDWAKKPQPKREARMALKAATEASDIAQIDAAIAQAEAVKITDPEACAELAAAMELKTQLEEAAAAAEEEAAAAAEAAEAEEAAPEEEAPAEE